MQDHPTTRTPEEVAHRIERAQNRMINEPTKTYDEELGRLVPSDDDPLYAERTPGWVAARVADRRRRLRRG